MREQPLAGGAGAGRVVPNFAVTGGRARAPGRDLPLEALVTTAGDGALWQLDLAQEYRRIVSSCVARPHSLVEIAALLDVPIGVVRVLVGDLAHLGYLRVHLPLVDSSGRPRRELLERLLDGLRAQ